MDMLNKMLSKLNKIENNQSLALIESHLSLTMIPIMNKLPGLRWSVAYLIVFVSVFDVLSDELNTPERSLDALGSLLVLVDLRRQDLIFLLAIERQSWLAWLLCWKSVSIFTILCKDIVFTYTREIFAMLKCLFKLEQIVQWLS